MCLSKLCCKDDKQKTLETVFERFYCSRLQIKDKTLLTLRFVFLLFYN